MFPYRYSLNGYISFTYFRLAKKSIINPKHKKFAQKLHTWSKKKNTPSKKNKTRKQWSYLTTSKKMTFFAKLWFLSKHSFHLLVLLVELACQFSVPNFSVNESLALKIKCQLLQKEKRINSCWYSNFEFTNSLGGNPKSTGSRTQKEGHWIWKNAGHFSHGLSAEQVDWLCN